MKNTLYIFLLLLAGFSSCQTDELPEDDRNDRQIYLSASFEPSAESRAPYEWTEPSLEHPLQVAVWASTTSKNYKNNGKNGEVTSDNPNGDVALHSWANFQNPKHQLLKDAIYPNAADKLVYFVAMHPKDGWIAKDASGTADDTKASNTFTGKEDVMFAPEISGKYGLVDNVKVDPVLHFYHLLTYLRFEMVAESEAVRDAWGPVENITIKSKSGVTIDLSQAVSIKADISDRVTFTGPEIDMDLYQTSSDTDFPGASTPYTLKAPPPGEETNWANYSEEVAYVLCESVSATKEIEDVGTGNKVQTAEYELTLTTQNRTDVKVKLDLMANETELFEGNTMGKEFTIVLKFKLGNTIAVKAMMTDWQTGGVGSGDLTENM